MSYILFCNEDVTDTVVIEESQNTYKGEGTMEETAKKALKKTTKFAIGICTILAGTAICGGVKLLKEKKNK